jgi:hypothetical protein
MNQAYQFIQIENHPTASTLTLPDVIHVLREWILVVDQRDQFIAANTCERGQWTRHVHKWAILAADQGVIDAGKLRDSVAPHLSPHEMDESYRRASETLRAIEKRRKDS